MSPYQIFTHYMKDKLQKKNPDAPMNAIMKAIQLDWGRMPPYRKRYFYKQANDQKIHYEHDIEIWEKEISELKKQRQLEIQQKIEEEEIEKMKERQEGKADDQEELDDLRGQDKVDLIKDNCKAGSDIIENKGYTETYISSTQYEENKQKGIYSTFLNHGKDFENLSTISQSKQSSIHGQSKFFTAQRKQEERFASLLSQKLVEQGAIDDQKIGQEDDDFENNN